MSIEIPSMQELLAFVPTAHYGDHLEGICDVPQPYTAAETTARGGALHISSVLPALTDAIGAPVTTAVHHNAQVLREQLGIPQARSAIIVLIDGLGYWNLASRVAHGPYLRTLMKDSVNQRPISTCAPSTTTAAMATFGTGTCPGLTCMTGYTQRNPATNELCQLIQFRHAGSPEDLQREPTIFELLQEQEVRATSVGLTKFMFSPLTRATLRGSHYIGRDQALARIQAAAQSAQEPGLTYLYLRDIDKTGHAQGWESEQWIASFESIDDQLDTLRRLVPKGTVIVIVADHGMVNSLPEQRIDIAQEPELNQAVALMGGEPRSVMLYAENPSDVEQIVARWKSRLEGLAWVRTREEAIADGLFGPTNSRVQAILGDVIVQAAEHVTIVDSRIQADLATRLPGVHGSQTKLEMDIPCLIDMVE